MTDTTETPTTENKVSSAFTRVVGKIQLNVVNSRQNKTPASVKSKWCVLEVNGKKTKVHSQGDKKYDQIDSLRAREIALKAKAQKA